MAGLIPKNFKLSFIRRLVRVPELCSDPRFTIKVADTKDELEEAYKLLHECYVGKKLMEPNQSQLRCNLYSFLPETTTVIVKFESDIVGTVTLIRDNRLGLPSDKDFLVENTRLRNRDQRLVEVSALAVSKRFQKTGHTVSLMLMKYLYNYAQLIGANNLICTVHPRAQNFYESLWGFERSGDVIQYPFVNGAFAIHLNLALSNEMVLQQVAKYGTTDLQKSLPLWVLAKDSRFKYPVRRHGQILDPVFTPDLLEYFFLEKTNLFKSLTTQQKIIFLKIYTHFFGPEALSKFFVDQPGLLPGSRGFRMEVEITAAMNFKNQFEICKILDISPQGAYIVLPDHYIIEVGEKLELSFKIGSSSFRVDTHVAWINNGKSKISPFGIGVQFQTAQPSVTAEAQKFTYLKSA